MIFCKKVSVKPGASTGIPGTIKSSTEIPDQKNVQLQAAIIKISLETIFATINSTTFFVR
jgi:hypothetical protein